MSTINQTATTRKRKAKTVSVMETINCHICGEVMPKDESIEFERNYLCSECCEHETLICDCCSTRIWNDDNAGDYETRLCEDCYSEYYTKCGDCGIVIRKDNAYYFGSDTQEPYCHYCYNKERESVTIHNYSYKPTPIFYGDETIHRYFGVELEIDDGGRDNDNAHHLLQVANRTAEHIYIKSDGSLNDGFEIVTHPMTLDYHMNDMEWKKLTQKALRIGYKSHKTTTCGLHVHINRNTFSNDYIRQELCIGRILFIVERFWQELLRFSRRTQGQVNQWAHRYGFNQEPHEILNTAKSNDCDRYTCVNLVNSKTIEFRIFKGTLKYNTIIATLQLANHICDMASSYDSEDITELSWCEFVEKIDKTRYPELIAYMKERRLYVNEPVETEEDD